MVLFKSACQAPPPLLLPSRHEQAAARGVELQAADRTVTQMVDDRQPWQLVVLLAAFAIHLGRLCDSLWTQAQLSDSKVVYALCAGQLALLTGSALRVQQQLESRGSECQLHILSSMPLPHRDRQRMRQALRGNTAARCEPLLGAACCSAALSCFGW